MSTEEALPPNFGKLDTALRSIGYSFEAAVADVVDNSIDAEAANVLIRLITRATGFLDLVIVDDGKGMNSETLKEAMRFGADVNREIDRLGKFGLGLKLASLSQAKELRVVTVQHGIVSGRGWLEHGISRGFAGTLFDEPECGQIISDFSPSFSGQSTGTLAAWTHLYRVGHNQVNPGEHAQKLLSRLADHLALAFHRFLTSGPNKVNITLDIHDFESGQTGLPRALEPLNPFGYEQSGAQGFPADMHLEDYDGLVQMRAHIWPPNSSSPNYKLPGGANRRQGFYFYRKNRLIQGGGWNGIREAEPHSSLARVEIDLSPRFDIQASLDVKKVDVQLPPALIKAIQKAETAAGVNFKKYCSTADDAYRTRTIVAKELPWIPTHGLPTELRKFLRKELRSEATARHRPLKIRWENIEGDLFFEINKEKGHLNLNKRYRRQLLNGLSGSSADLPVLKCLLFLVLADDLANERMSQKSRERILQINRVLREAVQFERQPE